MIRTLMQFFISLLPAIAAEIETSMIQYLAEPAATLVRVTISDEADPRFILATHC